MVHQIEISPEVAKLARSRNRSSGASIFEELSRAVAVESVYECDPEVGLVLEDDLAFSNDDLLRAALGVNDIVVNGVRFDVRPLDDRGQVSVSRALVRSQYACAGTLAIQMKGTQSGRVAAFIPHTEWESLDDKAGDAQTLAATPRIQDTFDLNQALQATPNAAPSPSAAAPPPAEIAAFLANRVSMPVSKQRQMVNAIIAHREKIGAELAKALRTLSSAGVGVVLKDSATWNKRVIKITEAVAPKFKRISREEIATMVAKLGEAAGGQPEAPAFRKQLLASLTREELSRSLGGAALKKATEVADSVLSGKAVNDAIKDVSRNQVAVQIAVQIKKTRRQVEDFVDATTQELTAAFQQLAVQPAYATHSSDPATGMDSINEALKLLDAGELAESVKQLDKQLAEI